MTASTFERNPLFQEQPLLFSPHKSSGSQLDAATKSTTEGREGTTKFSLRPVDWSLLVSDDADGASPHSNQDGRTVSKRTYASQSTEGRDRAAADVYSSYRAVKAIKVARNGPRLSDVAQCHTQWQHPRLASLHAQAPTTTPDDVRPVTAGSLVAVAFPSATVANTPGGRPPSVGDQTSFHRESSPTALVFPRLYSTSYAALSTPASTATALSDDATLYSPGQPRDNTELAADSAPGLTESKAHSIQGFPRRAKSDKHRGGEAPNTMRCGYNSPITGERCTTHFKNKYDAGRHIRDKHGEEERSAVLARILDWKDARLLRALQDATSADGLQYRKSLSVPGPSPRDNGQYICWPCRRRYSRQDALMRHLRKVHRAESTMGGACT